jgi:murein DD-endopeptidase MepM/ murein hydrolase activator NlpD
MKDIARITLFFALLALPAIVSAQTDDPQKKSEIKVNKLDVIYEDEEYKGVVIDQRNNEETENHLYQSPFLLNEPDEDEDDEDEDLPRGFNLSDDGAESEDEILLEGFDTAAIHLPKLNPAEIEAPITVRLRDLSAGEKFTWPTPWSARPSSHYGPRRRRWHYGLDLAQPTGEPIYAAFDGVVRISKYNRSYGNLVIIHHANGIETYYAHMSKRFATVGEHVKSGDIIGLCGNTGRSFGSHLHFEIRYKGNALNPENVIDCETHDLINDELVITSDSFRKVAKHGRGSRVKSSGSGSGGWYRVRSGDTLEKIARRNGTTVRKLCQLNGIKETKTLHPGDRLRVSGSVAKAQKTQNNKGAQNTQGTQKTQGSQRAVTYTVRQGDNLSKIAKRNGISVNKLCQLNGINENGIIRPGQKLKVK